MSSTDAVDNLWYRNRMVWLMISIPALTVAGCMLTIYLAITNPEILVKDPALEGARSTSIPRDALP
jgi:hypothetical protein